MDETLGKLIFIGDSLRAAEIFNTVCLHRFDYIMRLWVQSLNNGLLILEPRKDSSNLVGFNILCFLLCFSFFFLFDLVFKDKRGMFYVYGAI